MPTGIIFEDCKTLLKAEFPKPLKEVKLVLIEKISKSLTNVKTYRTIILLNVFGKMSEVMLEGRLGKEIKQKGGMHVREHGFRKGRSTIGTMREVWSNDRSPMYCARSDE